MARPFPAIHGQREPVNASLVIAHSGISRMGERPRFEPGDIILHDGRELSAQALAKLEGSLELRILRRDKRGAAETVSLSAEDAQRLHEDWELLPVYWPED